MSIGDTRKIGEQLKELRELRGLKQKVVASSAGMKATMLCNIEKGDKDPKFSTVERILEALGANFSDLNSKGEENARAANH